MPEPDPQPHKARPLEILIVDDDKIVHFLHSREQFKMGHPVSAHEYGSMALRYVEQHRNPNVFFLVLLDLNMPVMNGWEFLEACRKRSLENMFIVIVTSSINAADRLLTFDFPQVLAYCEKPFTRNKMMKLLELKVLKPFISTTV